jgi:hypothetical protein
MVKQNDLVGTVPDGVVVVHHQIFQRLDQPSLHVTGFGSFDGSVNQTLATSLK